MSGVRTCRPRAHLNPDSKQGRCRFCSRPIAANARLFEICHATPICKPFLEAMNAPTFHEAVAVVFVEKAAS